MIEIRSQVSLEELLKSVNRMDTEELEQFFLRVSALRAQRLLPTLTHQETTLLQEINQGLLPPEQQRYDELSAKRRAATLTSNEREELLTLIERIEEIDAERIQALGKLAQLRGVSATELMSELGITRRQYA
jgi:hypothetical protein